MNWSHVQGPVPKVIRCYHCHRVTFLSEPGARHIGWRIYQGETVTGRPVDDVACPRCSGRGKDGETWNVYTWDVECLGCGWRFTDTWVNGFTALRTASLALKVTQNHEDCDTVDELLTKVFRFIEPEHGTVYSEDDPEFRLLLNEKIR